MYPDPLQSSCPANPINPISGEHWWKYDGREKDKTFNIVYSIMRCISCGKIVRVRQEDQ